MSEYDYKTLYSNTRQRKDQDQNMLQSGMTLRNRLPSSHVGGHTLGQRDFGYESSSYNTKTKTFGTLDPSFGLGTTRLLDRQKTFDPYNSELSSRSKLQNSEGPLSRYSYRTSVERLKPTIEYNRRDKLKTDLTKIELERLLKENIELKMKLENFELEHKRANKMQIIEYEYKIKQVEREKLRLEEDLAERTSSEERLRTKCKESEEQLRHFKSKLDEMRDQLNFSDHKLAKFEYEAKRLATENNELNQINKTLKLQNSELIEFTLYTDVGDRDAQMSDKSQTNRTKLPVRPISKFSDLNTPNPKQPRGSGLSNSGTGKLVEILAGLASRPDLTRSAKSIVNELISNLRNKMYSQEDEVHIRIESLISNFENNLGNVFKLFISKVEHGSTSYRDIETGIDHLNKLRLEIKDLLCFSDNVQNSVAKPKSSSMSHEADYKSALVDINAILKRILTNLNTIYTAGEGDKLESETVEIAHYIDRIITKPDSTPRKNDPNYAHQFLKFKLNCTSIDLNEIRNPAPKVVLDKFDRHVDSPYDQIDESDSNREQLKNVSFNTLIKNFTQPNMGKSSHPKRDSHTETPSKNFSNVSYVDSQVQCDLAQQEIDHINGVYDMLKQDYQELSDRFNHRENERREEVQNLHSHLQHNNKDIAAYKLQTEQLSKLNEEYVQKINSLNHKIFSAEDSHNKQLEAQLSEYSQHTKTLQQDLMEGNASIKQRDQLLRQAELTKNQLLAQLADMSSQLDAKIQELEEFKTIRLKHELDKLSEVYKQNIAAYNGQISDLNEKIQRLEAELMSNQKTQAFRDNILESEVQRPEGRDMVSMEDRKVTVNTKTNEIIMDGNVIAVGGSHLSSISAKLSTSKLNVNAMRKSQSEKLIEPGYQIMEDENEFEVEIQVFIRELLEAHKRKVIELEQEMKKFKTDLTMKQDELNDLKIRFQKLKIENHSLVKLKNDNNLLLDKLDEKEDQIHQITEKMKILLKEREERVVEGQPTLPDSRDNTFAGKEQPDINLVELRKKNIELMEENLELADQVDEVQKENEELHEKIKALERDVEQSHLLRSDGHKKERPKYQKGDSFDYNAISEHQKRVDDLVMAIEEKNSLIENMQKTIEFQKNELQDLRSLKPTKPESNTSLETNIRIRQLEDAVRELSDTVKNQKRQLSEYESEIDNLQNILNSFNEERNEYLDKIQRITAVKQQIEEQTRSSSRGETSSNFEMFLLKTEISRLSQPKENFEHSRVINYSLDPKTQNLADSKI